MRPSLRFIFLLGFVSLFADITYEGARSITGPFLAILGASGAVVGVVAGLGEFAGYAVRILSGFLADRMNRLWPLMYVGYFINLVAVPLLAFAGHWGVAALLLILERIGKGIRAPARDTMLSFASKEMGRGWGFGIHEAFDRFGALTGPVFVGILLLANENYRIGFLFLGIPAFFALLMLLAARIFYPRPEEFEPYVPGIQTKGLTREFWLYLLPTGCVAAGYADFALIAYHFQKTALLPPAFIPFFYAVAMGIAGLAALFFGKFFDRLGIRILLASVFLTSLFAPCVFLGNVFFSFVGMILWGLGLGCQSSVFKAIIAKVVSPGLRGSAYGIYGLSFGLFWFLGSAIIGFLYDKSLALTVLFSMGLQLFSLPLFKIRSRS